MTLGNMRAKGVRSIAVSCWQCHREAVPSARRDHTAWSAPAAASSARTPDRTGGSLGPAGRRHRRRGRPAELARAADAGDADGGAMAVNGSSQGLTVEQLRVLQILDAPSPRCGRMASAQGCWWVWSALGLPSPSLKP
jgi:hypothetical protein